jgi:biotin transport system substrate-specific component
MGSSAQATFRSQSLHAGRILGLFQVLGVALVLAALAPVAIPIPGLPAPLTLQTLAVAGAGLWVGANRAALGVAFWILWGALGMPVWAGAQGGAEVLLSVRGGYLLAMPIAAGVAGALRATPFPAVATFLTSSLIVLAGGALSCWLHSDWKTALQVAVLPYLSVEALKGICGHFAIAVARSIRAHRSDGRN